MNMTTLNIVKQAGNQCHGEHVDPEYTYVNGRWDHTDARRWTPVVETLHRQDGETDAEFSARANQRANQLDRLGNCPNCYR